MSPNLFLCIGLQHFNNTRKLKIIEDNTFTGGLWTFNVIETCHVTYDINITLIMWTMYILKHLGKEARQRESLTPITTYTILNLEKSYISPRYQPAEQDKHKLRLGLEYEEK
jgi:hypothetical protein